MEYFDELENMAISAAYEESEENTEAHDPNKGTIKMWQERFGYTYEQAAELIGITGTAKKSSNRTTQAALSPAKARTIYALKLDGPLSTAHKVQIAANLPTIPKSYHGSGEEGGAAFCKIDGRAKVAIEKWLSKQNETGFRPLFVPEGKAYKQLSPTSIYPTLGKDATLPQHRPQDPHLLDKKPKFGRSQEQFPVWYFFYGTLASVSKLRSLFGLLEDDPDPFLHEASVKRGRMETWGEGKYNALVDGPETSSIKGSAYQVMSEEHEDSLRKYETNAYEVVRCTIEMDGGIEKGCTLRFVGKAD